jgi:hemerythrin-like domain-containing protein
MKAIELLMQEHRTIEKVLDAMEVWMERVLRDANRLEQDQLARFVSFFLEFVDERHHAKEEHILFATMVEQGFPREQGPIGVMLQEHDLGRSLVAALANLSQQPTPWCDEDRRDAERTARTFTNLLRNHIQKEDRVLYPLAEQRLTPPLKDRISVLFDRFEADHTSCGENGRLRKLTQELIESYVAEAPPPPR